MFNTNTFKMIFRDEQKVSFIVRPQTSPSWSEYDKR